MNTQKDKMRVSISAFAPVVYLVLALTDGLVPLFWLIICAALHECGHLFTMQFLKVPVEKIKLLPFGVSIKIRDGYLFRYRDELFCALAGPVFSLLSGVVFLGLYKSGAGDFRFPILFNLFLFTLNILPIMPLDGGRALHCLLLLKLSLDTSERVSDIVSVLTLLPVLITGIYLLKVTGYNFSLLLIAVYLTVSFLLKNIKLRA